MQCATKRLYIRRARELDKDAIQTMLAAKDTSLYLHALWDGDIYVLELIETGAVCGCVGIFKNETERSARIEFAMAAEHRNKGLMSEALRELVYSLLRNEGINRVEGAQEIYAYPAGGAVMRKIGMQYEGMAREYFRNSYGYHSAHIYAIIKSDLRPIE